MPEGPAKDFLEAIARADVCVDNMSDRLAGAPDASVTVAKAAVDACSIALVIQSRLGIKEGQDTQTADELAVSYRDAALQEVMTIRAARCTAAPW